MIGPIRKESQGHASRRAPADLRAWSCLAVLACGIFGCNDETSVAPPLPPTITETDLIGKWRLVKMGGQAPAQAGFKSVDVVIAREGTWSAVGEKLIAPKGFVMAREGKWLLVNGSMHYDFSGRTGAVRPQIEAGRLKLDPDFLLLDTFGNDRSGEYERIE